MYLCPDKCTYPHDRRADKDSYPRDRNVTDDLCSLIKLCFAFIMVHFSHNRHRSKREKQEIDHSAGDKN